MNVEHFIEHINVSPVSAFRRAGYLFRTALEKILYRLLVLAEARRDVVRRILDLRDAIHEGRKTPSTEIYNEEFEVSTWRSYYSQLVENNRRNGDHTRAIHEMVRKAVSDIITIDADVGAVLNFGVSCGYSEWILAKQFPEVKFIGIDRSQVTKELNDKHFMAPNLFFHAADTEDFLKERKGLKEFTGGIFIHVRTAMFLYPAKLQSIYDLLKDCGFRYVVLFETVGWSRQTYSFYRFSTQPKESVVFRGSMKIHNYPGMLAAAGYLLEKAGLMKYPHRDADIRQLKIVARLKKG